MIFGRTETYRQRKQTQSPRWASGKCSNNDPRRRRQFPTTEVIQGAYNIFLDAIKAVFIDVDRSEVPLGRDL